MKGIKIILAGITIILASLFLMGICIINVEKGGPEGITLATFIVGLAVTVIGFFNKE
ncbi:MAG: hypothetical protein IJP16_01610 [Clostridia bacterium]|nr:hypothetical protein [Clostridia bacterium]